MKHPDESDAATHFVRQHAQRLIDGGMDMDQALDESVRTWEGSLLRSQMMKRFNDDLRRDGKPTLRVPLFEVARFK